MNKKHYTKPFGYGSMTPEGVKRIVESVSCLTSEGWIPARPEPYYSFRERLVQAWHVLTYRADALYWGKRKSN